MTTAPQARARIAWIDTGRGIAIVLVVLFHTANWLGVPEWQAVNEVVASLRMPLFFALSGMFARKWVETPWADLWRTKLSLYMWVFVVWETIGSVAFLLGLRMQGIDFGLGGTLRDLAVSPVRPRFELWFIWALSLFYVCAKLTSRVDRRLQFAVATPLSVVALSGLDLGNVGWNGLLRYYLFFLVGVLLRHRLLAWGTRPVGPAVVLCLGAWLLLSVAVPFLDLRLVPGVYFVNCVLGLFAGITLSRGLVRVAMVGRLGTQTLPIYLAHTPFIIVLSFMISTVFGDPSPGASALVLPPLAVPAAIWLSLALHRVAARGRLRLLYEPPSWLRRLPVGSLRARTRHQASTQPHNPHPDRQRPQEPAREDLEPR